MKIAPAIITTSQSSLSQTAPPAIRTITHNLLTVTQSPATLTPPAAEGLATSWQYFCPERYQSRDAQAFQQIFSSATPGDYAQRKDENIEDWSVRIRELHPNLNISELYRINHEVESRHSHTRRVDDNQAGSGR